MEYVVLTFGSFVIIVLVACKKMLFIGRGKNENDAMTDIEKQTFVDRKYWKKIKEKNES